MNAPVLSEATSGAVRATPPAALSPDWPKLLPPIAVGLLLLGLLFNREVLFAVQTWDSSTAYNHCFLVIPIAFYLYWDRRADLAGIQARPLPIALLLGLPLAVAWLFAERLGIMEGRQLIAISFVEVMFLAILGKRLWWALAGPLLYLYFLVPFGEFLTPRLQDVTTWFIRHGLDILGIPAYIDGYIIEIPQGTFFVAEACAGLRFLIASVAFGCLYALMMYRSTVRRTMFIVVSIIVPIIANGFRGIGIVYLGYLLGSAQAAAADHIIYGWIFFSVVILLLIALGLPFRQDDVSTRSRALVTEVPVPFSMRTVFAIAIGLAVVAAISPAIATGLTMEAAIPIAVPSQIALAGCDVQPTTPPADPGFPIRTQRVQCSDERMDMAWTALPPRSTAGPVMAERRRMVAKAMTEGLTENWLTTGDGSTSPWRVMASNDPPFITAVAVWVDGHAVRPGLAMRLRMALTSLVGSPTLPMVVTVTPIVDWDTARGPEIRDAEASLPRFLLAHPDLLPTVSALSVSK